MRQKNWKKYEIFFEIWKNNDKNCSSIFNVQFQNWQIFRNMDILML